MSLCGGGSSWVLCFVSAVALPLSCCYLLLWLVLSDAVGVLTRVLVCSVLLRLMWLDWIPAPACHLPRLGTCWVLACSVCFLYSRLSPSVETSSTCPGPLHLEISGPSHGAGSCPCQGGNCCSAVPTLNKENLSSTSAYFAGSASSWLPNPNKTVWLPLPPAPPPLQPGGHLPKPPRLYNVLQLHCRGKACACKSRNCCCTSWLAA